MGRILHRTALIAVAAVLACASILVQHRPAWACSCVPVTTRQAAELADAVFRGTVTDRDKVGHGADARIELRFEVSRVFKGRVYADQVVTTARDSAGCGVEAEVGSQWVIFATQELEGTGDHLVTRLTTSLCSGNLPSAPTPTILGRGGLPEPGASDTGEKSVTADQRVDRALAIAGLGALGLLVLGGIALFWLWRPGHPS